MRSRSGTWRIALAVVAVALAWTAAPAKADFGVSKWEAGTCTAINCTYASPESVFFTQVAGRPPFGITDFTFNKKGILGEPDGAIQDVRVDLPPGLSVNPEATPKCTEAELTGAGAAACTAKGAKVGQVEVTPFEPLGIGAPVVAPVFNIVPRQGEPAEFGFRVNLLGLIDLSIFLEGSVNWESDYHEGFTIRSIPDTVPLVRNRLAFEGQAGDGSFITVGSNCGGSTTTGLSVRQHGGSGFLHYDTTPIVPVGGVIKPTGCGKVPFKPGISVNPGTNQTDSPTGSAVTATVPFEPDADIGQANVKRAEVSLPNGMGLNPSAAPGLQACTEAQFGKGIAIGDLSRTVDPAGVHPPPIACPAASKIGTVSIETPVLPANSLPGTVFLAEQLSRDPASGKEYRIFVSAESPRYGVYVRLIGEVKADPVTGRLTAVFDEPKFGGLPQVPFSAFKLQFDGAKGVLTSPPTCGPNTTNSVLTPWTGNANASPTGSFTLTNAPGGGACAKTMAERPFAPAFNAKPGSDAALAFTPFSANITRPDGQQELKGVDVRLPPGATAKLAGVPYCPPADIAAAAARPGANEKKNPSCPDNSQIGVATVAAGSGASPLKIEGRAYLAGPYKGAKLSVVVITPALAGPFDLGTVVVRAALFLDPETARVHPVVEIPHVYGGAKLSIRQVFLNLNRKEFTLNGTNCRQNATTGSLLGGGADPTNPAAFAAAAVSVPFQASGCKGLKFRPRLNLRLYGQTKRAGHPKLRAFLKARAGDANIARASVALPHALFLDQASLGRICTRVKFAADDCPKNSIYGFARAFTPLLGKPLEGPVYLRSSDHLLPDLVAHLEGQVDIDLVGRIDSFKGGIRTTFDTVPDVPVQKFVMTLPGGRHGLLESSTNLCAKPVRGIVQLKGQNGKKANKHPILRTPCKKGKKRPPQRSPRRPLRFGQTLVAPALPPD
jgi:hypothetical protein